MKITLPILQQDLVDNKVQTQEKLIEFKLDTSVYSEERWEIHFPLLAKNESLFEYIDKVHNNAISDRVKIACMLKAIYCFIDSDDLPSYKEFAQLFNLATPNYTSNLIESLRAAFAAVYDGSAVKN